VERRRISRVRQKHPLVHENDQCKPIVIETIKFLYDLDMEEGKDVDLTNPIARPRVPHEIMFVVGGWSGGSPTNVIETYDTRADRWITVEHADRGTLNSNESIAQLEIKERNIE